MRRTLSSNQFPSLPGLICSFQHFLLVYLGLEKWKCRNYNLFPRLLRFALHWHSGSGNRNFSLIGWTARKTNKKYSFDHWSVVNQSLFYSADSICRFYVIRQLHLSENDLAALTGGKVPWFILLYLFGRTCYISSHSFRVDETKWNEIKIIIKWSLYETLERIKCALFSWFLFCFVFCFVTFSPRY